MEMNLLSDANQLILDMRSSKGEEVVQGNVVCPFELALADKPLHDKIRLFFKNFKDKVNTKVNVDWISLAWRQSEKISLFRIGGDQAHAEQLMKDFRQSQKREKIILLTDIASKSVASDYFAIVLKVVCKNGKPSINISSDNDRKSLIIKLHGDVFFPSRNPKNMTLDDILKLKDVEVSVVSVKSDDKYKSIFGKSDQEIAMKLIRLSYMYYCHLSDEPQKTFCVVWYSYPCFAESLDAGGLCEVFMPTENKKFMTNYLTTKHIILMRSIGQIIASSLENPVIEKESKQQGIDEGEEDEFKSWLAVMSHEVTKVYARLTYYADRLPNDPTIFSHMKETLRYGDMMLCLERNKREDFTEHENIKSKDNVINVFHKWIETCWNYSYIDGYCQDGSETTPTPPYDKTQHPVKVDEKYDLSFLFIHDSKSSRLFRWIRATVCSVISNAFKYQIRSSNNPSLSISVIQNGEKFIFLFLNPFKDNDLNNKQKDCNAMLDACKDLSQGTFHSLYKYGKEVYKQCFHGSINLSGFVWESFCNVNVINSHGKSSPLFPTSMGLPLKVCDDDCMVEIQLSFLLPNQTGELS